MNEIGPELSGANDEAFALFRDRTGWEKTSMPRATVDDAIQQGKRRFAWLVARDTFMVAAIFLVIATAGLGAWMSQATDQLETQMLEHSIGGQE